METVLLRKMTMKSCFNEGKYAGVPILQMIQLNRHRYLRWCYYNLSNIDFMPEIKEAIRITPEFEINKPGTDPDMDYKLNDYMYSRTNYITRRVIKYKKKKLVERTWNKTLDRTSKGVLEAINHGKLK